MDAETFTPCDAKRCRHRSYVFATMPSGNALSFCGHHGVEYTDELRRQGAVVKDYRYRILETA